MNSLFLQRQVVKVFSKKTFFFRCTPLEIFKLILKQFYVGGGDECLASNITFVHKCAVKNTIKEISLNHSLKS
jgi:hypothetical protein